MASKLFKEVLSEIKPETTVFVKQYLDLVERISEPTEEQDMPEKKHIDTSLEQQPHITCPFPKDGF
jgi:hypothetical protein